jgi:hypothetical protein
MMEKDKLTALKDANIIIGRKLKSLNFSLNGTNKYKPELTYQTSNSETSVNIFSIKGGQKSETFIENEFQRIICIEGKIAIFLIGSTYNEKIILSSSNTLLIPPQTEYHVESLEDSEVIVVFKPRKEEKEKILVGETIYNKI